MPTDTLNLTADGVTFNLTLTVTQEGGHAAGVGTVTAISGTAGGSSITGLSTYAGPDQDIVNTSTVPVDEYGISFKTASGVEYNIYDNGGQLYAVASSGKLDTAYGSPASNITFGVCYVAGTRVLTDRGEIAVENLAIGDTLVTASGARRPVRWLGNRRVNCARYADPAVIWPIRIQAGAFAPDVPSRDLWVSPGHAILVNEVLIQAHNLVNGATVVQVPSESVEYWHVELDSHDIIIAEGLAAESYLDTGNRAGFFNNGGAYLEAHPDFKPKHFMETCVPLVFEGAALQAAKLALRERAEVLGYTMTDDADVHVLFDGERIDPVRLGAQRVAFMLPADGSSIELRSRSFVPAQVRADSTDGRSLGLRVLRLQIDGEIALDDAAAFGSGWYPLESDSMGLRWRWTRECVPLPAGTRLVVIDAMAQEPCYWVTSQCSAVTVLQARAS